MLMYCEARSATVRAASVDLNLAESLESYIVAGYVDGQHKWKEESELYRGNGAAIAHEPVKCTTKFRHGATAPGNGSFLNAAVDTNSR